MIALTIISGRSGSGKSTALHVLEDMGFYCIDNLPVSLLPGLVERLDETGTSQRVAVSIDARNLPQDLASFEEIIGRIDPERVSRQIIFLDSAVDALFQRFSETRRKHPLSNRKRDLTESLTYESELLAPISAMADLAIDTTSLTIHALRDLVRDRVAKESLEFALLFQSFAFKHGVPVDADMVFDARCLPNPHWRVSLRSLTGLDAQVQDFLDGQAEFIAMFEQIRAFLDEWMPRFEANNRSYMTVAIGCTGGQHRSVYIAERLHAALAPQFANAQIRHRELNR